MELKYANRKVKEILLDAGSLVKKVGLPIAKLTLRRMEQLRAMTNMQELMQSGLDNPHPLQGNLKGCIGWSVTANVRLILDFELVKDEVFDLNVLCQRKIICIKGVVDYHGGKNEWIIS